jgi:hypothetical protein
MKRAFAISLLLACCGVLLGDSPDSRSPSRESPSLLQDLVRMSNAGLSDETVLAYAKAHRAELPPEVSARDLVWLRQSGVSETVIRYMTAIDVRPSDAGEEQEAVYDNDEAARYSSGGPAASAADSYSDGDYGAYAGGDYAGYPETYYNDYYPDYPGFYPYPYPVYFFVSPRPFFARFRFHNRGFDGRRRRFIARGGFERPRFPRRDFDHGRGRDRAGFTMGRRGPGRPVFPRAGPGQGFRGPWGGVARRGPANSAFPRGLAPGRPGPRVVARNGGFGHPAFAGGGRSGPSFGRGPIARSGGGGRGRR